MGLGSCFEGGCWALRHWFEWAWALDLRPVAGTAPGGAITFCLRPKSNQKHAFNAGSRVELAALLRRFPQTMRRESEFSSEVRSALCCARALISRLRSMGLRTPTLTLAPAPPPLASPAIPAPKGAAGRGAGHASDSRARAAPTPWLCPPSRSEAQREGGRREAPQGDGPNPPSP